MSNLDYVTPEGEQITESEAESRFADFFNDLVEPVRIGKFYTFEPARALKELDMPAYRQDFLGWLDSEGYEEI